MRSAKTPDSDSSSLSTTLLEQVRAHEPEAWERLVRLYSPLIYHWCRRSGISAEDAADLLQDVFTAVMLHLNDFRRQGPADSFTGWLATITRNKIRDHYRVRQRRAQARGGTTAHMAMAEQPQVEPPTEPAVTADAGSAALLARRALELIESDFEQRTWQAFLQTTLESRRAADVAHDLAMSVPAVYMAKSRVLRRLREVLAALDR